MKTAFCNILKGKVVIVGVGHVLKGDDGCGPALIEALKGKINAVCIDAGAAPESFLGKIIKQEPDTILFIDAADLSRAPGEYEIIEKNDIGTTGLTTHNTSLKLLINYLDQQIKAEIYLLGIQPQDISLGAEISESVRQTILSIAQQIQESGHV